MDGEHVVCLRELGGQLCRLPIGLLSCGVADDTSKHVRQMWAHHMGPPPKRTSYDICAAINARLRKAARLGDTLLFVAVIDDCAAALPALQRALPTHTSSECELAIRETSHFVSPAAGTASQQILLFQYLHVSTELSWHKVQRAGNEATLGNGKASRDLSLIHI